MPIGRRITDGGLVNIDLLEASLERRVLFDVLAVLVEGRRADATQLATGEGGLEEVAGVHRAVGLASADDGMDLIDEEYDLARRVCHLGEHRLEPLLELAAVLGPSDQRAQVE